MMGKRERESRLVNPKSGSWGSFSTDLLLTAKLMLEASIEDRKGNSNPPPKNHMSKHVVGSTVLLFAGLESWLHETIAQLSMHDPALLQLVKASSLIKKYESLCAWNGVSPTPLTDIGILAQEQGLDFKKATDNLRLAIEVRNEIVHPVPLPPGTQNNVPTDLLPLHEMGLLMSTEAPNHDFTFGDKLRSYALGYWCWEVVDTCVHLLVEHLKPDQQVDWTAQNFSSYKDLCAPKDLSSIH